MGKRIWKRIAYYSRKYVMVRVPAIILVACAIFIRLVAKYQARVKWDRRVAVATAMSLVLVSVIPAGGAYLAAPEDDEQLVLDQVDLDQEALEPVYETIDGALYEVRTVEAPAMLTVTTTGSKTVVDGTVLRVTNDSEYLIRDDLDLKIEQNDDKHIVFYVEKETPDPEEKTVYEPSITAEFNTDLLPGEYIDYYLATAPEGFEFPEPVVEEESQQNEAAPEETVDETETEEAVDASETEESEEVVEPESESEPEETVDESEPVSEPEPEPTAKLSVVESNVISVAAPGEDPEEVYPIINFYRAAADPSNPAVCITGYNLSQTEVDGIGEWHDPEEQPAETPAVVPAPQETPAETPAVTPANNNKSNNDSTSANRNSGSTNGKSDDKKPAEATTADSDVTTPADDSTLDGGSGSAAPEVGGASDVDATAEDSDAADEIDEETLAQMQENFDKLDAYYAEMAEREKLEAEEEANVVSEIDEETERPDDIISVTLPTTFTIPMYGAGSEIDVLSEAIVIENHSDFPVDVNISKVDMKIDRTFTKDEIKSVDVPVGGDTIYDLEKEAKTCHLNLQILLDGIKTVFAVNEGITTDLTSFTLDEDGCANSSASMCLYGEATYGLLHKWDDGDLKVGITFDFRKAGEADEDVADSSDAPKETEENVADVIDDANKNEDVNI